MKKTLLSAFIACGIMFSANAQEFTDGSTGFIVDYSGTDEDFANCLANQTLPGGAGYQYAGGNISGTPQVVQSGSDKYLTMTAANTVDAALDPGYLDIYTSQSGNCNAMRTDGAIGVDMSNNPKVQIVAKSSVDGAKLRIYLGASTAGAFPSNTFAGESIIREITLTTSFATYTVDLSSGDDATAWGAFTNKNNINMLGFTLATADAVYDVQSVALGSEVVTTNLNAALPTNVKYYPNPSSSNITVEGIDVTSVKVMDVNGLVVREGAEAKVSVEGLATGLYFLQINGYKPVKVMVK